MRANIRAGRRGREGGVRGASVEGFPRPLLNHLYLFHCVLVSSSVAVVAIYEMALKLFSVSAFPLYLPLTLSLFFYFSFCCFCCFPFQLLRLLFLSLRLCQSNWRSGSGSGSMLLSIKLVVGQDVTPSSPLPHYSSLPLLAVTPFSHRSHFRPALYVPCPLAIVLPKAFLSRFYSPPPIPLIYSSRVKLSSEQTFISVHFYYYKKKKRNNVIIRGLQPDRVTYTCTWWPENGRKFP